MRIISGAFRGRGLVAPVGDGTRPTSDRVRQALFDMLMHADWGGRAFLASVAVLDGFAGTGALGLEALSRGAIRATFFEQDRAALAALRANIAGCGVADRARVVAGSVLRPGVGGPHGLIFLDPPYGQGLVERSVNVLRAEGWLAPGCIIVAETGRAEASVEAMLAGGAILAHRVHGAAQVTIWRE